MISLAFNHSNVLDSHNKEHFFDMTLEQPFAISYGGGSTPQSIVIFAIESGYNYQFVTFNDGTNFDYCYTNRIISWTNSGTISYPEINDIFMHLFIPDGPSYLNPSLRPRYTGITPGMSDDISSRVSPISGDDVNFGTLYHATSWLNYSKPALSALIRNDKQISSRPSSIGNLPQLLKNEGGLGRGVVSFFELQGNYPSVNGYIYDLPSNDRNYPTRKYNVRMPSGHFDIGNESPLSTELIHDPTIP